MFKKVLIANRGEIAKRIAFSAKKLGIQTATFCGEGAPPSYLLGLIDDFITITVDAPSTYLDQDFVINKAKEHNCDCIHPGFGFLSENSVFAQKVTEAGIKFVGPGHEAISSMASKSSARSIAIDNDVPVIEGLQGFKAESEEDIAKVEEFAKKVGFPILIKAALGGGGKGMRVVRAMDELKSSAERAYSEAINSFGDGGLIVEKYLENPRHVEVQVLGDRHGNVAIFGDRDCSIQRRHQKIVEEAPAPNLDPTVRRAMHEAARRLAEGVSYQSAGTVEYLVDTINGKQSFYFLEMNTRLQVEHPVTEEVFGVDLVKWQFLIASGEPLPKNMLDMIPRGHSIESRIYAEDSFKDFFPTPCLVYGFKPMQGPGIRWEVGLDTIDEITGSFDPMVAKLVTYAQTRSEAINLQIEAIDGSHFGTDKDNTSFLKEIYRNSEFRDGILSTSYISKFTEEHLEAISRKYEENEKVATEVLNALESGEISASSAIRQSSEHNGIITSSFSLTPSDSQKEASSYILGETSFYQNPSLPKLNLQLGSGYTATSERSKINFCYAIGSEPSGTTYRVRVIGNDYVRTKMSEGMASAGAGESSDPSKVIAPVPGKIISIEVSEGTTVEKGAKLFVLESMKMEFEVFSEKSGTISEILCSESEQVEAQQLLANFADE